MNKIQTKTQSSSIDSTKLYSRERCVERMTVNEALNEIFSSVVR